MEWMTLISRGLQLLHSGIKVFDSAVHPVLQCCESSLKKHVLSFHPPSFNIVVIISNQFLKFDLTIN